MPMYTTNSRLHSRPTKYIKMNILSFLYDITVYKRHFKVKIIPNKLILTFWCRDYIEATPSSDIQMRDNRVADAR